MEILRHVEFLDSDTLYGINGGENDTLGGLWKRLGDKRQISSIVHLESNKEYSPEDPLYAISEIDLLFKLTLVGD